jgi:hypothetical protein
MEKNKKLIPSDLEPNLIEELLKKHMGGGDENGSFESKKNGSAYASINIEDILLRTNIQGLINELDSQEIKNLKVKVKDLLEKDTIKALKYIKSKIMEDSSLFDDITGLIARYNRIDKYLNKGLVSYAEAHLEFTKIDNSVIMIINEIDKQDLNKHS